MSGLSFESIQTAEDCNLFTNFAISRGYRSVDEYGLTDGPKGLTIVNSTIAPYVERIHTSDGTENIDDALTQTCVRLRGIGANLGDIATHSMFLTSFKMGGNITNTRKIDEVTTDFVDYMVSSFSIGVSALRATYHAGHPSQLKALLSAGLCENAIEAVRENSHVWVDWQFGTPGPTGSGITILFEGSDGQLEQVGNIIQIDRRLKETDGEYETLPLPFVEVGFGIERLRMCIDGKTDVFQLDPYRGIIDTLKSLSSTPLAIEEPMYRGLSDVLVGTNTLIEKGVLPGTKTNGSIVRKLVRHLFVASELAQIDKYALIELFPTEPVRDIVEGEFRKFDALVVSAPTVIKKYLRKNPSVNHQTASSYIHSTYGIPQEIVQRYLPA